MAKLRLKRMLTRKHNRRLDFTRGFHPANPRLILGLCLGRTAIFQLQTLTNGVYICLNPHQARIIPRTTQHIAHLGPLTLGIKDTLNH